MRSRIGFLFLDMASAAFLGFGILLLLLPFALYLGFHADDAAYIELAKWGGNKIGILAHWDLANIFQVNYLLFPTVALLAAFLLRWPVWRSATRAK